MCRQPQSSDRSQRSDIRYLGPLLRQYQERDGQSRWALLSAKTPLEIFLSNLRLPWPMRSLWPQFWSFLRNRRRVGS